MTKIILITDPDLNLSMADLRLTKFYHILLRTVLHAKNQEYKFCIMSLILLKDSRHPSHTHLGGRETHRSVKLNRTQSAVDPSRRTPCRQRFYSGKT